MKIHIPEPCHENWNNMSPNGLGRHCSSCNKTVVDFTKMTDYGISKYLKNNPNACGKFYNFQLNREISEPKEIKLASKSYTRLAAFGLSMAYFFNLKSQTQDTVNISQTTTVQTTPNYNYLNHIKVEIVKNDSISRNIKRLAFKFNEFALDTLISNQNTINFQVPDSVK